MGKELDETAPDDLRVGTAEREDAAQVLAAAMGEGRLTLVEYEERLDSVFSSSTRGELRAVVRDLPETTGSTDVEEIDEQQWQWREYWDEWRYWLGGAVIMTGIWGATSITSGELANYWPAVPLGIWAAVLVAMIFFPSDDDSDDEKN